MVTTLNSSGVYREANLFFYANIQISIHMLVSFSSSVGPSHPSIRKFKISIPLYASVYGNICMYIVITFLPPFVNSGVHSYVQKQHCTYYILRLVVRPSTPTQVTVLQQSVPALSSQQSWLTLASLIAVSQQVLARSDSHAKQRRASRPPARHRPNSVGARNWLRAFRAVYTLQSDSLANTCRSDASPTCKESPVLCCRFWPKPWTLSSC
jgi:hypothetical protein